MKRSIKISCRPTSAGNTTVRVAAAALFLAFFLSYSGIGHIRAAEPPAGAAPKIAHDWPSYLGANGAFSEGSGVQLIDDITKVRLLWQSEEKDIGFGKAVSSAGKGGFAEGTGLAYGGEASPIVAGGLVIQFYTTPCGEATWAKGEQLMGAKFKDFAHFWKVSADEIVIAMDAATGKTRWKQVFNDKGINTCPGKRGGFAVTPCAADGKVFAMGTMGRLYCLDLATGKPVWESAVDSILNASEKYKAQGIKDRKADRERPHRPYGFLLVVDGILLVHNWSAGGLLGIDAATGKQLWQAPGCLSGYNCPAPVKVNGKQYIACVNGLGEIRMLDHKTGKIFWTHALKSQHLTQPVFGDECLMVFEPHPDGGRIGTTLNKVANSTGVLAAYRLTEEGAARAWVLPSRYMLYLGLDSGPRRKIVARNGLVYHVCDLARSANDTTSSQEKHLVIVREKDGQIVKESDVQGWNPYLWGNRLITVTDIQHRPRAANAEVWQMYNADPADFKPLGAGWHVNGNPPVHLATGGYEVPVLEPFADGLFFCRVWGGIRCYDLRK